jgi:hypothetical protein
LVRKNSFPSISAGLSEKTLDEVLRHVKFRQTRPLPESREAAIVCLTRGYPDLQGYDSLVERNRSIYQFVNRHRARQYALIVWHEGNILPEHQRYIAARELNDDLRFVDISEVFRLPAGTREATFVEDWSVGYRLMCLFHSYYIWQYTTPFDYVMRIDEDCTLTSAGFDPIESLSRAGGDFGTVEFMAEPHEPTNRTLAPFARRFAAALHPDIPEATIYNQVFPSTNFYVTRTAFWRQLEVQRFLYAVTRSRNFVRFRWGDAVVLGIALNMFATPGKVHRISHLGYRHASHNWTIEPIA